MTSITFPRPTKALLSMNDRHHWRRKAADVKVWRAAPFYPACPHAISRGGRHNYQPPSLVLVTLDVHGNRRRDPANYFATVKPIVDGLVDAGWWPDDTPEYVMTMEPVLRVVPTTARLMVRVDLLPRVGLPR